MKFHALWLSASVLTLGWCGAASAQVARPASPTPSSATPQQQDASDDGEDDTDVVTITAERRTTDLQRTAISATVLTGETLEAKGITSVDQLQFIAPGTTVNNFGQGIDFNIRGIGKAEHNTQTTTGVITYRDGVATFPGYFTAEPYYDIARVEILRGPQGTFVGQNATGGAVFVTSNDPVIGGGHHGYIAGQIGNYSDIGAQGALNLPVSDTFAARAAFNISTRDSFYDITGPYSGDDGIRMGSARLGLLWKPTDRLSVLFKTDVNYLDLSGYPSDPVNSTNDLFDITANAEMLAVDKFVRSTLKIDYDLPGGLTLRSVSGYQRGNTAYRADLDGTSTGNNTFRDSVDEEIYSQEVNLISPDEGPVRWVLGAYYQHDEYDFPPGEFVIGVPPGVLEYQLRGTNPKETSAIFGQISMELPAGFELQFGGRYSDSKTSNDVFVNQYGTPITQQQSAEWQSFSGKAAINWTVDAHNFIYAFAASGNRPGGLNVPVGLGLPAPFDEEKVNNFEIGWKAGWFNGRVRTQVDFYHNDYDNFQVIIGYPAFPVFGIEVNNPNTTTIRGFEAQLEAVFGKFSLDAGLGIMESELGAFYATDPRVAGGTPCDPGTGPSSASCINLAGREQTYAPEFTFNIGGQYIFDLPNGDTLTPRINVGHVSQQWATLFQNVARGDRVESRTVTNAQLAWVHSDYIVTLFANNLTDEHYVAAINSGLRFAGAPRQFGLRVAKLF
jgi:iron complex outermembrane receptor protein